jgi:hypothetical protein
MPIFPLRLPTPFLIVIGVDGRGFQSYRAGARHVGNVERKAGRHQKQQGPDPRRRHRPNVRYVVIISCALVIVAFVIIAFVVRP